MACGPGERSAPQPARHARARRAATAGARRNTAIEGGALQTGNRASTHSILPRANTLATNAGRSWRRAPENACRQGRPACVTTRRRGAWARPTEATDAARAAEASTQQSTAHHMSGAACAALLSGVRCKPLGCGARRWRGARAKHSSRLASKACMYTRSGHTQV